MIKGHTRARNFLTQWPLPIAAAIVVAAGAGATASAPPADAQPPGTLCGHVQNRVGVSLPVIVLSGDPDCATAVHVASNAFGFVAVERPMQQLGDGFANLWQGDCWRPFFSPAAFP